MGVYVGIDVGKLTLDIGYEGQVARIANTASDIDKWIKEVASKLSAKQQGVTNDC